MKFPYLLIGYARLEGINRLLASLKPEYVDCIFLCLDGAKSEDIEFKQEKIILAVSKYCSQNDIPLKIWRRNQNFGIAVSIISALDWFYSYVDFGVVLEDDLILSPQFFAYLPSAFNKLKSTPGALMISGNQFFDTFSNTSKAVWTNYPLIWGWATTAENWIQMREGIVDKPSILKSFNSNRRLNYWNLGADRVLRGIIDTWDIPLARFMVRENKLCLLPPVNLVSNAGADSVATHTQNDMFPINVPLGYIDLSSLDFPDPDYISVEAMNSMLDIHVFKIGHRHRVNYFIWRLLDSIFLKQLGKIKLVERIQNLAMH